MTKFREHDPSHPYVRRLIGCGHGRLFTEPCIDCEIVDLRLQYRNAMRAIDIVRCRLQDLGAPVPSGLEEEQEAAATVAEPTERDATRAAKEGDKP